MTKKGFAELIGVTPNTIHRYETGETVPSEEYLEKIATALGFPDSFFSGADLDRPRRENASFRGLASKTERVMESALASGSLAYLFDDWISGSYSREELDLPEFTPEMPPQVAARLLRQYWHLGDKPIENMVQLLEVKGIRVFSLAENTTEIDAFSVWRNDVPYVFLNRFKSSERSRFDAAHELCHLCLHKHGGSAAIHKNSPIEKDAQAFAGAFLMPEADIRSIVTTTIYSVEDLIPYKKRWRVAAAALAYRLRELGLISDARVGSLYVEMSRRGWLKQEPSGIPREQSHLWQQIFDDLRLRGITKATITAETGVPTRELESFLFGMANMLSIDGDGSQTARRKVDLRLVK